MQPVATAYISRDIFDEFLSQPEDSDYGPDDEGAHAAFEAPLNSLIECLNIFGTSSSSGSSQSTRVRRLAGEDNIGTDAAPDETGNGRRAKKDGQNGLRIDQYFGSEKGTAMRLSYGGRGHSLVLLMFVIKYCGVLMNNILTFVSEQKKQTDPQLHVRSIRMTPNHSFSSPSMMRIGESVGFCDCQSLHHTTVFSKLS